MTDEQTQAPAGDGITPIPPQELAAAKQTALAHPVQLGAGSYSVFSGSDAFGQAQRMAACLASGTMIPDAYRTWVEKGNQWEQNPAAIGNCMIALELANRMRVSPLMIMQNMSPVKGKPAFAGSFVAALVNQSPLFSRLKYEVRGDELKPDAVRAYATELATGEVLFGTWITWEMVVGEGWNTNKKWTTMRAQMFQYRAATFWVRAHAPDLLIGMPTTDEVEDIGVIEGATRSVTSLNDRLSAQVEGADLVSNEALSQTLEDIASLTPTDAQPGEANGTRTDAPAQTAGAGSVQGDENTPVLPRASSRRRRTPATVAPPLEQAEAPAPAPAEAPAPAPAAEPSPDPVTNGDSGDLDFNVE